MKEEDLFDYAEKEAGKSFLKKVGEFRSSTEFKQFLEFISIQQKHKPFNALLLWRQRPNLHAAFTEEYWKKKHNRNVIKNRFPLIYFNRQPYGLVWDLKDTEGAAIPTDINQSINEVDVNEKYLSDLTEKIEENLFIPISENPDLSINTVRQVYRRRCCSSRSSFTSSTQFPPPPRHHRYA